ncbi:hypothetical protein AVEN_252224-1 [Araneus ventricosus]|uniref:Uncharacterized protein n=1 Tax=Araneus ventricosus TaxID=182803 RepID=A0A4Y2T6D6_ARAVE|nr:hypothetical protein AVEN_252224-1 [Araneus ventricosus]
MALIGDALASPRRDCLPIEQRIAPREAENPDRNTGTVVLAAQCTSSLGLDGHMLYILKPCLLSTDGMFEGPGASTSSSESEGMGVHPRDSQIRLRQCFFICRIPRLKPENHCLIRRVVEFLIHARKPLDIFTHSMHKLHAGYYTN